jgi:hypothetical protein
MNVGNSGELLQEKSQVARRITRRIRPFQENSGEFVFSWGQENKALILLRSGEDDLGFC